MTDIKHTLEGILTVTVGERAQVPVSVVGEAVERITKLEGLLEEIDGHINAFLTDGVMGEERRTIDWHTVFTSLEKKIALLTTTEDKP